MTENSQSKADHETGVELVCDGLQVPLNPFVQRFIRGTIRGMVRSLEGIPENPATIEVKVSEKEENNE